MSAGRLIEELNKKINGWAMYHRHASSKRTFACVDYHIFTALWRWCRWRYPNKSAHWTRKKYFMSQGSRSWIFTGICLTKEGRPYRVNLMKAADVRIVYRVLIRHEAIPYNVGQDSDLAIDATRSESCHRRGKIGILPHNAKLQALYHRQGGRWSSEHYASVVVHCCRAV